MSKKHLVTFVLDETGSMDFRKEATISGFNEWMQEMEKFPGTVIFTMIKFNSSKHELLYKKAVLGENKIRLNKDTYRPSNLTPLYDAIGKAVRETEGIITSLDEESSVTFVILTDGEENASHEYSLGGIKSLIKEKEEEGWTFTYMGVSQDAWQGGHNLGLAQGNTMLVGGSSLSMSSSFHTHAMATTEHLARGGNSSEAYYAGFTDASGRLINDPDYVKEEDDDETNQP